MSIKRVGACSQVLMSIKGACACSSSLIIVKTKQTADTSVDSASLFVTHETEGDVGMANVMKPGMPEAESHSKCLVGELS